MPELCVRGIMRCPLVAVLCLAQELAGPPAAHAQSLSVAALAGDWVRVGSNYDPNDQMRISIAGSQATLTRVPTTGHSAFKAGQALWMGIAPDGSLRVRGSDGRFYPATLTMSGGDSLTLSIDQSARGNDQVWRRAGPSLDGEWVRIAPGDASADGMRVLVDQDQAAIRFLPADAPRTLRIGTRLWRGIAANGALQVLGGSGDYRSATVRLEGTNRVWVEAPWLQRAELWVRPAEVLAARAGSSGPLDLTPPAAAPAAACVSTSRPHRATGVNWWWHVRVLPHLLVAAERIGLGDYAGLVPGRTGLIADLEVATFPGLEPDFSVLLQESQAGIETREERNLHAGEFDTHNRSYRAAGYRLIDIEAYETPRGVRYAGVWATNPEGIEWNAHYKLTAAAYGQLFQEQRAAGFRLVDVEALRTNDGVQYAAIWHRSCDNDNWRQFRDMDRGDYQRRVDSLGALGFGIVDLESYRTPDGQRYAAIWEQLPGTGWAVRSDRTLRWFLNDHRLFTDQGMRLVDFESYDTGDGVRYAGVWAENDARYRLAVRKELDDSLQSYRDSLRVPGISVAIIHRGEVIYRRGVGWADVAREIQAHSGTIYLTASIAKAIGGTLAARLEERETIDLTQPTRRYVTGLDAGHSHTLEQLLSKTGCVVHYPQGPEPKQQSYSWQKEALEKVQDRWMLPNCTPGQLYHYSTHGFTLLGAALEAVTGKRLGQLLEEEIARPAGLRTLALQNPYDATSSRAPLGKPYAMAEPYVMDSAPRVSPSTLGEYEEASWKVLGGGLQIDAADLARFGAWTLNGALGRSARVNRLWRLRTRGLASWDTTKATSSTALAWEVRQRNGESVAEHGGAATGARSYLTIYRNQDLVVAVLSNQREGLGTGAHPVSTLAHTLAAIVLRTVRPP